jgi:hypothetical protein
LVNADQNLYDLYVTIPSRHQVVRYQPATDGSGYPTAGMSSYLAVDTDVSGVDDMYVDGSVYLVDRGRIVRYDQGDNTSGWSPQPPPSGGSPFYTKLTAPSSTPDAGVFYAYDEAGRRIIAFVGSDGNVAGEFGPPAGLGPLMSPTGMFMTTSGGGIKVYWTEGDTLWSLSLITAGPAPASSP